MAAARLQVGHGVHFAVDNSSGGPRLQAGHDVYFAVDNYLYIHGGVFKVGGRPQLFAAPPHPHFSALRGRALPRLR